MIVKKRRGFGAMDPEAHRRIAVMGGKAAHEYGNAHEFTSEEARAAGKVGGRKVSRDRKYMAEIGRRGGLKSKGGQGANYVDNRLQLLKCMSLHVPINTGKLSTLSGLVYWRVSYLLRDLANKGIVKSIRRGMWVRVKGLTEMGL